MTKRLDWKDVAVWLFLIITIGSIVAAIPMAIYMNDKSWLALLIPIVFYLS